MASGTNGVDRLMPMLSFPFYVHYGRRFRELYLSPSLPYIILYDDFGEHRCLTSKQREAWSSLYGICEVTEENTGILKHSELRRKNG